MGVLVRTKVGDGCPVEQGASDGGGGVSASPAHGWWDKTSVGERERPRWGSLVFFRARREVDEPASEELALRAGWRRSAAEGRRSLRSATRL